MSAPQRELRYGTSGRFICEIAEERIVAAHAAPDAVPDVRAAVAATLAAPVEFPSFAHAVFPDDHIVLAVDRDTPHAADVLAEVWAVCAQRSVLPGDVTILQPASFHGQPLADPRSALPADVRERIVWRVHDPTETRACAYLAATATGERVYLARALVDADVVVSIGPLTYDTLLGYRGTHSAFYPGLSSTDAIRRAHGQGHDELGPDDDRPLWQLVDEIAWLLGAQFSIQVIPGAGEDVAAVIAGLAEPVLRRGKQLLRKKWRLNVSARPELVIAAVDRDASGHGWEQVAAALDASRRIVARDGRIVLLSELDVEPGDGINLIRDSRAPRDALQPIRESAPPDLLAATHLAKALDWANVYLLSRLDPQLVEELFMVPLSTPREVERVIEGHESCAILAGAQHVSTRLVEHART